MDSIQRTVTIPILVVIAFPALIANIFIFYYAIKFRKQLIFRSINNHVIFLILLFDFLSILTELPISLYYLAFGNIQTKKICTFWIYWDYTLQITSLFLTTYAAIERYFLIFHKHIMQRHILLFHYIPLLCFTMYTPIMYVYFIIILPCKTNDPYDINAFGCGGACYFSYIWASIYDGAINCTLPCVVTFIISILLIIRVTLIKRKAVGSSSLSEILKKNRRMILQLLGVSLLSLISWTPWLVVFVGQDFFDPLFANWFITYILHYLPYITASASPFFALIGLPEIRKELRMKKPHQTTTNLNNICLTTQF